MFIKQINYVRPDRQVSFSEIEDVFLLNGKEIISLAWSSLSPNSDNYISRDILSKWFESFFNVYHSYECTDFLIRIGLLCEHNCGSFFNEDYRCCPTF